MKRGKPLKRRTPLRAKKGLAPGKPLERRTPLKQGDKPLRSRPKPPRGEIEKRASEAFRRAALARCKKVKKAHETRIVCPCCGKTKAEFEMQAHHVLSKQALKKYVAALRLPKDEAVALLLSLLWDKRNALGICVTDHDLHTRAKKRIARAVLRREHFQFAEELGLAYILDREYPS